TDVQLTKFFHWPQKLTYCHVSMGLQCLQEVRRRSVQLRRWRHYLKHSSWMDWMKMRQASDICIIITSHRIGLEKQNHPEDQEDVRLDMEHWQNVRLCQFFQLKQSFHMQFVRYRKHLNPMVLRHKLRSVHLLCR